MWCTRWFLPLLILPLPTAPPYFLIVFLISLTLHSRPCFYCVMLLSALFVSSCYWQPLPIETRLSTPWSSDVTTFADALNSTLPEIAKSRPFPNVVSLVDRCWCDLSAGNFFEPYNITSWEVASVERLKASILVEIEAENGGTRNDVADSALHGAGGSSETDVEPVRMEVHSILSKFQTALHIPYFSANRSSRPASLPDITPTQPPDLVPPSPSEETVDLPSLRKEYDLRPYGLEVILDFGWGRPSSL